MLPSGAQANSPTFGASAEFGTGTQPDSVAVADVDADGKPV